MRMSMVYGKPAYNLVLHQLKDRVLNVRGKVTIIKANRKWRKKRHLKSIHFLAAVIKYSVYKQEAFQFIFEPLGEKYVHNPLDCGVVVWGGASI